MECTPVSLTFYGRVVVELLSVVKRAVGPTPAWHSNFSLGRSEHGGGGGSGQGRKEGGRGGRPLIPAVAIFRPERRRLLYPLRGVQCGVFPGNSLAAQAQGCLTNGIPPAGVKVFGLFLPVLDFLMGTGRSTCESLVSSLSDFLTFLTVLC